MCNGEAEVESLAYGWIWIHVGQDLKKKKADVAGERKLSANMEALKKQFAEEQGRKLGSRIDLGSGTLDSGWAYESK